MYFSIASGEMAFKLDLDFCYYYEFTQLHTIYSHLIILYKPEYIRKTFYSKNDTADLHWRYHMQKKV